MDEWTLNDLLECSVCLERLDTSSKVLPCQHTFCKKCLEEIVNTHKELRCPECRVLVDAKIDELPPNVLLMRILEGMRNSGPNKRTDNPSRDPSVVQAPNSQLSPSCLPVPAANTLLQNELRLGNKPLNQFYAHAVYDYLSKEPGDLSFKKGDVIILRKKIDNNWYHGECGGHVGAFPLSYVQIMSSSPSPIPQCKALYDFRMASDDEDGCLTFNKGDVITVIRRVDENWAEGKVEEHIGIFPLAFVELNNVARSLIKLSSNTEPGTSRVAPPTPVTEEVTPLIMTNTIPVPTQVQTTASVSCTQTVTDTSSSSSSTTTPTTSSSSTPSSPASPPHCTAPPLPPNKRHSFGSIHLSSPQSKPNRYSAEILSPPDSSGQPQSLPSDLLSTLEEASVVRQSQRHRRSASSEVPPVPGPQNQQTSSLLLPATYVALYPYKPQKADELELKYGTVYVVTERCQDGWFKGRSAQYHKCGVFPGNYVAPAKSLPALQAQMQSAIRSYQSGNSSSGRGVPLPEPRSTGVGRGVALPEPRNTVVIGRGSAPRPEPRHSGRGTSSVTEIRSITHSCGASSIVAETRTVATGRGIAPILTETRTYLGRGVPLNEPRSPGSGRGSSSETRSPGSGRGIAILDTRIAPVGRGGSHLSDILAPVGRGSPHHSDRIAPVGRGASLHSEPRSTISYTRPPRHQVASIGESTTPRNTCSPSEQQSGTVVPPPNMSVEAACVTSTPKSNDKNRDKKEKVNFMRRFTSMKKSKSPPPVSYSMDNPVFEDSTSVSQPIHVRSGSCPNQLLTYPSELSSGSHTLRIFSPNTSHRSKHKDRSQGISPRSSIDMGGAGADVVQHRKSHSIDTSSIAVSDETLAVGSCQTKPSQTTPQPRERFKCIVPYPPNSEYELELKLGDVIFVHKKREDGWYKGTQQRTGRTGLFPASFVQSF